MKRLVILGAADGYATRDLAPFVFSLRDSGFDGPVVVATANLAPGTAEWLAERGVETISIEQGWDRRAFPTINSRRYFAYRAILSRLGTSVDAALLTDTRDVFFQRDPRTIPIEGSLLVFLEDASKTIATCPHNSNWIKGAYGAEGLARLGNFPISCSGITLGSREAMERYLLAMTEELARLPFKPGGMDQGAHNKLLRDGSLPDAIHLANETGPVLTMGYLSVPVAFDEQGDVVVAAGHVPAILHQYDRHPPVRERLIEGLLARDPSRASVLKQ